MYQRTVASTKHKGRGSVRFKLKSYLYVTEGSSVANVMKKFGFMTLMAL